MIALCLVHLSLPVLAQAPNNEPTPEVSSLILIQENSIVAQTSHENPPETYTLGSLTGDDDQEVADVLMKRICVCESGDNFKAINPNSGALGRCQMIPSTRDYVEKKWNIKIDWENPDQQWYACLRLLKEEGTGHWGSPYTNWGTYWCWSK